VVFFRTTQASHEGLKCDLELESLVMPQEWLSQLKELLERFREAKVRDQARKSEVVAAP